MRKLIAATALLLLSACATAPQDEKLKLDPVSFKDVPHWQQDRVAESLPALQKSCDRIKAKKGDLSFGPMAFAGNYADWQKACTAMPQNADDATARLYFEQYFNAYALIGGKGRDGLFTGYYEPSLAAGTPQDTPLYARPSDMVTVDLGAFKPELKGQSITGRVAGEKLVPYYTRAEIEKGVLKDKAEVLAYAKDPVDVFFLQIQGSGQVVHEGGDVSHIGYAAQNGHAYYAIGQELIKNGALKKEDVSMQSIRAYLEAHPDEAQGIMNKNPSFVFFRKLDGSGPLGAEGVTLTPGRSLAVDKKKLPYGAPVFVDAENPDGAGRFSRLMVAQDTGGAIRGTVRGDVFWGPGDKAADIAGKMKSKGQAYILLPKSVIVPDAFIK